jgi:hypothetical protein
MPVVWGNHNNSDIYLNVAVFDAQNLNASGQTSAAPIPAPPMYKALIDTGAQKTMIRRRWPPI